MTEETKQAIRRGLENDLANAADNLARAQITFRKAKDALQEWEGANSGEPVKEGMFSRP